MDLNFLFMSSHKTPAKTYEKEILKFQVFEKGPVKVFKGTTEYLRASTEAVGTKIHHIFTIKMTGNKIFISCN